MILNHVQNYIWNPNAESMHSMVLSCKCLLRTFPIHSVLTSRQQEQFVSNNTCDRLTDGWLLFAIDTHCSNCIDWNAIEIPSIFSMYIKRPIFGSRLRYYPRVYIVLCVNNFHTVHFFLSVSKFHWWCECKYKTVLFASLF